MPGRIPLEKAINYAIDRRALAGAYGFEAGKRTDQMLPPCSAEREHLLAHGADPTTARRWLARTSSNPTSSSSTRATPDWASQAAQVFEFDMSKIGIEVDIRYFDRDILFQKVATRGEPFDVASTAGHADYVDPAAFLEPLLDGRNLGATGNPTSPTSTTLR